MTKEIYLEERESINNLIQEARNSREEDKLSKKEREHLAMLYACRNDLNSIYINKNSPVKVGEKFFCITANGRRLKGVADELSVMNGDIFVSAYYPVVNGTKKGSLAFISFPPQKLIRIQN